MAKLRVIPWEEKDSPTTVHLVLKRAGSTTDVFARREDGGNIEDGYLAAFSCMGLTRKRNINPDLGFPLDEHGRIKLHE